MKDLLNKYCKHCGIGRYTEKSLNDDWDGMLTCGVCGDRRKRWYETES